MAKGENFMAFMEGLIGPEKTFQIDEIERQRKKTQLEGQAAQIRDNAQPPAQQMQKTLSGLQLPAGGQQFTSPTGKTFQTPDVASTIAKSMPEQEQVDPRFQLGGEFGKTDIAIEDRAKAINEDVKKGIQQYNDWRLDNLDASETERRSMMSNMLANTGMLEKALEVAEGGLKENLSEGSKAWEVRQDDFNKLQSGELTELEFFTKWSPGSIAGISKTGIEGAAAKTAATTAAGVKAKAGAEKTAGLKLQPNILKGISDIMNFPKKLETLSNLIDTHGDVMGPLSARLKRGEAAVGVDREKVLNLQKLDASYEAIKQVIAKAMEGGVLRKEDMPKYEKILGSTTLQPKAAKQNLKTLKDMLTGDVNTYIQSLKDSGYNVPFKNIEESKKEDIIEKNETFNKDFDDLMEKYGG